MTTPIVHGYPDWGRYQAQSDVVLLDDQAGSSAVNFTYARMFVGGNTAVAINFINDLNNVQVTVSTFSAATAGTALGSYTFQCNALGGLSLAIPVVGPWLEIQVLPVGGVASWGITVWTVSGPLPHMFGELGTRTMCKAQGVAVGAGLVSTITSFITAPGEAMWSISSSLATWQAFVTSIDVNGVLQNIDTMSNTQGPLSRKILLPPTTMQLRFSNTTAGAGTWTGVLIAAGLYSGG